MARALCLAALWIVRIILGIRDSDPVSLLATDILVMAAHVWATKPLRRQMGKVYGLAPSWTGVLEVPLGFAIILAIFDFAHAWH